MLERNFRLLECDVLQEMTQGKNEYKIHKETNIGVNQALAESA